MDEDTYQTLRSIAAGTDGFTGLPKKDMKRMAQWAVDREDVRRHDAKLLDRVKDMIRASKHV